MGMQTDKQILLVYNFGGQCAEAYGHPIDLAERMMRELDLVELAALQDLIRKRKRALKDGSEILVGKMRPRTKV